MINIVTCVCGFTNPAAKSPIGNERGPRPRFCKTSVWTLRPGSHWTMKFKFGFSRTPPFRVSILILSDPSHWMTKRDCTWVRLIRFGIMWVTWALQKHHTKCHCNSVLKCCRMKNMYLSFFMWQHFWQEQPRSHLTLSRETTFVECVKLSHCHSKIFKFILAGVLLDHFIADEALKEWISCCISKSPFAGEFVTCNTHQMKKWGCMWSCEAEALFAGRIWKRNCCMRPRSLHQPKEIGPTLILSSCVRMVHPQRSESDQLLSGTVGKVWSGGVIFVPDRLRLALAKGFK